MSKKKAVTEKEFLDIIHSQRSDSRKEKKFRGTFLEYLDLVKKNPEIVILSHKRLRNALESHGVRTMDSSDSRKNKIFGGDNIKIYDYFDSEFFGMERVISKIMRFLNSAASKGEESRQVLLLMGPVGAGKSALTEHIKSSLEGFTYYHLKMILKEVSRYS